MDLGLGEYESDHGDDMELGGEKGVKQDVAQQSNRTRKVGGEPRDAAEQSGRGGTERGRMTHECSPMVSYATLIASINDILYC